MSKNSSTRKIDKDNFIEFLASATPRELNRLIEEKGKPPKRWSPVYFFRHPEEVKEFKNVEVKNNE